MTAAAALIGVDWGSTHLRAYLIDEDGSVLERSEWAACGAPALAIGEHAGALARAIAPWRGLELPILACGMVGARNGWREVPYRSAPADAASLCAGLLQAQPGVWLVPGVLDATDPDRVEVMRGEETQILGAREPDERAEQALAICPGTHSKWARLRRGSIVGLRTCVTGDLYAALRERWPGVEPASPAWAAFDRGVARGAREPLASALFSARADYATRRLQPEELPDYLSGLLIGAEIAACRDLAGAEAPLLIGAPVLAARYGRAMRAQGLAEPSQRDAAACVARGLMRIWREKGER